MEYIWITETFLVIHFLHLIRSQIMIKEFTPAHHKENEDQFHKLQGQTLFPRDEDLTRCTIPMPTIARRPSTMSSQQISELQFDKFYEGR